MERKIDGLKLKPGETFQIEKQAYLIFPKGDNSNDVQVAIGENRFISARKARTIAALMAGSGMLIGGLGVGASYRMAEREAEQNPLELTCEQLSQKDTNVRGIDGKAYTLNCDQYGTPVLQERGE